MNSNSGAISALFSGFAFVGLIASVMLQNEAIAKQSVALNQQKTVIEQQNKSLKHQREALEIQRKAVQLQWKELKNSIEEQKKANEEFRKQNTTFAMQLHETSYYRIWQRSKDALEKITGETNNGFPFGNDFFIQILTQIYEEFSDREYHFKKKAHGFTGKEVELIEIYKNIFLQYHEKHGKAILPYVQSLVLCNEMLLINGPNLQNLMAFYNADLRFSINKQASKYICFVYIWGETYFEYPNLFKIVDNLTLWAHFNGSEDFKDNVLSQLVINEIDKDRKLRER